METKDQLESIVKLRQRLIRLIKLGETNELTEQVEDFVRRLFNKSFSIENFVLELQRLLNVTIKTNLIDFLRETIPLAQEYLRERHFDPFSWQIFRNVSICSTRLPSFEQARFRFPSTTILPRVRSSTNVYQEKLFLRFAQNQFDLDENAENLILQTFFRFVRHLIERIHFYVRHRTDRSALNSNRYEMTSHTREQIRFLIDLNKTNSTTTTTTNNEDFRHRSEIDETTSFIQRETRLKRDYSSTPRLIRATRQDLIIVMENQPKLKRSKTLLWAYGTR